MALDFDWIIPGLAQGSYPRPQGAPFDHGFDVIVWCAMEAQPTRLKPPAGKSSILFPMDDNPYVPITQNDARLLHGLADQLAKHVRAGRKVLVTCWEGRNRSGIVSALTLMRLKRMRPETAINTVRKQRRKPSLTNPMFERYLLLQ
ncbi:MAG TPA: dual specificity protein phosphatase family protein [Myxococcota bacterium]